jgi:hypothetical protein
VAELLATGLCSSELVSVEFSSKDEDPLPETTHPDSDQVNANATPNAASFFISSPNFDV